VSCSIVSLEYRFTRCRVVRVAVADRVVDAAAVATHLKRSPLRVICDLAQDPLKHSSFSQAASQLSLASRVSPTAISSLL